MTARVVTAAVALGSNMGDRMQHLEGAVREIAAIAGVKVLAVSRWIETEAADGAAGQGKYLNGALLLETRLGARELLEELLSIERAHGRERPDGVRHAPRTLDLDLLVHGDSRIDEHGLTVPHPRLAERSFVLDPLCQIAPELVVPGSASANGRDRSVRELQEVRTGSPTRTAIG